MPTRLRLASCGSSRITSGTWNTPVATRAGASTGTASGATTLRVMIARPKPATDSATWNAYQRSSSTAIGAD
ncbi:hypothetical protein, partial [Thermobifida halotolerans]|uniref:hypothetical protein n=1 Tax=Thermobifida halotolerans TaxID=483545 RepID=UPI000A9D4D66